MKNSIRQQFFSSIELTYSVQFLFVYKCNHIVEGIEDSPPAKKPLFCRVCGHKFTKENTFFCPKCGVPVNKPQTSETTSNEKVVSSGTPTDPISSETIPIEPMNSPQASFPAYGSRSTPSPTIQNNFLLKKSFNKDDYKAISLIILMAIIAHIMRIFLLYNRFPSFFEIVVATILYLFLISFIYLFNVLYYNSNGVYISHSIDRFELSQSLVLSSFFLTTIPFRRIADLEKSNLPDKVSVQKKIKNIHTYQEYPKAAYVVQHLQPRYYFFYSILLILLSYISLGIFASNDDPRMLSTLRVFTTFVSGILVTNVAPIFGRYNKEMSSLYKLRTLLVFLLGLIAFLLSLIDTFLDTLLQS